MDYAIAPTTPSLDALTRWAAMRHNQQLQRESAKRWALTAPAKRLPTTVNRHR